MDTIADTKIDVNEYYGFSNMPGLRKWEKIWKLYLCPICHEVILTFNDTNQMSPVGTLKTQKLLYPKINIGLGIPENIDQAYRSALKVRKDGPICCLALRRTLEMVCKNKGETKGDLFDKLKNLSKNGLIPPILDDMAHILRTIGNEAAHGDDTEFPPRIIALLIDFTKAILEYLYVLPEMLNEIQKEIEDKKTTGEKMEP